MALGKNALNVLRVIHKHDQISPQEIQDVLKAEGTKLGITRIVKQIDNLGKKGFIAGTATRGFHVTRLPRELMPALKFASAGEHDTEGLYWGWTVDHTDEEVTEQFLQAFGRKPETITRTGGGILAGPIGKGEKPNAQEG